jgi:hypothetical protein
MQEVRLVDHLLNGAPGVVVSLEMLGDIGVELPDGSVVTEESKSRTSAANPIADRAPDLWKTLRNWIDAIQCGALDPATTRFRLFVSREFPGDFVRRLHGAADRASALTIIDNVRRAIGLDQAGASSRAMRSLPKGIREHVNVVFSADREALARLIVNFELEMGTGRSIDDLAAALEREMIPAGMAPEVMRFALGWVKSHVTVQLEGGKPAAIQWDDFRNEITNIVRRLDRRDVLQSVAPAPSTADVDEHLRVRTYVRQLELVDVDFDEQVRAVTDFIKSETDRVEWAARGDITDGAFDPFESSLVNAWRNYRRECDIVHLSRSDSDRGQLLYANCLRHSVKLEAREVPEYFCRGSFQKLADERTVGWHPDYQVRLNALAEPAFGPNTPPIPTVELTQEPSTPPPRAGK